MLGEIDGVAGLGGYAEYKKQATKVAANATIVIPTVRSRPSNRSAAKAITAAYKTLAIPTI